MMLVGTNKPAMPPVTESHPVYKPLADQWIVSATGGTKHDQDKPRTDLLDYTFIEGVAKVLGFGAKKYAEDNWRKGISIRRLMGAALRHCFAFLQGENNDPESGLSHLYHAGCCLMFAAWMMQHRKDLDDRWKPT